MTTTAPMPAAGIGLPTSDTLTLTLLRARAADAVDRLLDLLDAIDGDADFEQSACEARGLGFACDPSPDDAENGHDQEAENEHGDDLGEGQAQHTEWLMRRARLAGARS